MWLDVIKSKLPHFGLLCIAVSIIGLIENRIRDQWRKAIINARTAIDTKRKGDLAQAIGKMTNLVKLNETCDRNLAEAHGQLHTLETRLSDCRKHLITLQSQQTTWFIACIVLQAAGLTLALLSSHWH